MSEEANTPVNTDPFISKVSLGNFKSVVDQEVDLARLTLLVGENSSGKSSILQALRLVQQAVRTKSAGDHFPLNGDLIRMGSIDEIRTVGAKKSAPVSIGITGTCCDVILNWTGSLSGVVAGEPGSTNLKSLHIETQDVNGDTKSILYLNRYRNKPEYYFPTFPDYSARPSGFFSSDTPNSPYSAHVDLSIRGYLEKTNTRTVRISGVKLYGFFPTHLAVKDSVKLSLIKTWLAGLAWSLRGKPEDYTTEKPIIDTRQELIEFAVASINDYYKKIKLPEFSLKHFYKNISYPPPSPFLISVFKERDNSNAIIDQYIRDIASNLSIKDNVNVMYWNQYTDITGDDRPRELNLDSFRDLVDNGIITGDRNIGIGLNWYGAHWMEDHPWDEPEEDIAHFHSIMDSISYLGPLRSAPSFIMLSSPGSTGGIGQEGELTASVLRYRGNNIIDKVPIPDGIASEISLAEAVGQWVSYLGLADDISVKDLAGLGLKVNVKPSGVESEVSLTSVGVGVSQVLPVVVLCLLAEPGSVILLEQPELHLHPGLQQRLADFFIAVAESGRQLIVETHSEYFVSRLRRRVVEDSDDELLKLVKIVSAERDRETGETTYRDIDLTQYGEIQDWPKGFFDQAAVDEREIIRGALLKRKARSPSR